MTPRQQLIAEAVGLATDHQWDGGTWQPLVNLTRQMVEQPIEPSHDRGTDASDELTEIRTTLSRARTAHETIRRRHDGDIPELPYCRPDPDRARMLAALTEVIAILAPYERTGATANSYRTR